MACKLGSQPCKLGFNRCKLESDNVNWNSADVNWNQTIFISITFFLFLFCSFLSLLLPSFPFLPFPFLLFPLPSLPLPFFCSISQYPASRRVDVSRMTTLIQVPIYNALSRNLYRYYSGVAKLEVDPRTIQIRKSGEAIGVFTPKKPEKSKVPQHSENEPSTRGGLGQILF